MTHTPDKIARLNELAATEVMGWEYFGFGCVLPNGRYGGSPGWWLPEMERFKSGANFHPAHPTEGYNQILGVLWPELSNQEKRDAMLYIARDNACKGPDIFFYDATPPQIVEAILRSKGVEI